MNRSRVIGKGRLGFKNTILPPTEGFRIPIQSANMNIYTLSDCHRQQPPNHAFGLGLSLFFGTESSQR